MAKFNIKYPVLTGTDGNLVMKLVEYNNASRIRFMLDFIQGQRPHHPQFGSLLRQAEQDALPSSTRALAAMDRLRESMAVYGAGYYTVESVQLSVDRSDPEHIIDLQINHSNQR